MRVPQQKGQIVSCLNTGQYSITIADNRIAVDSVAALVLCRLGILSIFNYAHVSTVNLPATCQGPSARKKLEKAATILQNVLRRVFVETSKTESVVRHGADAADPSGESINKTVLLQCGADQGTYAVNFAPVEAGVRQFCFAYDRFHWYRHYRSRPNSRSAPAHAALRRARLHDG